MIKKVSLLGVLCLGAMLCGCDDDNDDSAKGSASVKGEVTYVSPEYAPGVEAGVKVDLVGPVTLHATSDSKGIFTFNNVPAGHYTLVLHVNGGEATYELNIAEGKAVVLVHVRVNKNGSVTVYSDQADVVNIAGNWAFHNTTPGIVEQQLVINQNGESISGTLGGNLHFSGSVSGHSVSMNFTYIPSNVPSPWVIKSATGTINDDATAISGTWTDLDGNVGNWSATRHGLD